MSLTPFFVICGLVCLFWLMTHSILAFRLETFPLLAALLLVVFFAAAGDVLLGSLTGSEFITYLVVLIATPAIIPLNCLYFAHLHRPLQSRPIHFIWIVIPAILATASIIVAGIKGLPQTDMLMTEIREHQILDKPLTLAGIDRIFYIWAVQGFNHVMILETLNMVVYCIVMMRRLRIKPSNWVGFLFKGRKIRVLEIQLTLSLLILVGLSMKIFITAPFYRQHPALTILIVLVMAFLLFFFGLFALFGSCESISIDDLHTALRFNYSNKDKAAAKETEMANKVESIFNNAKNWDERSLVSRFQRLMQDEQLFLKPNLSLSDVAERLDSNKTYISKMVNQTYGIGFPEVLNILRVNYAQQYIRKHKGAPQEKIAHASGFLSASTFNTTFKRITGDTPKVWASKRL